MEPPSPPEPPESPPNSPPNSPESPSAKTRLAVRIDLDTLCRNLSLRLGMTVKPDKAVAWLRSERFAPLEGVWVCDRDALASLEPDEVEVLGPWLADTPEPPDDPANVPPG